MRGGWLRSLPRSFRKLQTQKTTRSIDYLLRERREQVSKSTFSLLGVNLFDSSSPADFVRVNVISNLFDAQELIMSNENKQHLQVISIQLETLAQLSAVKKFIELQEKAQMLSHLIKGEESESDWSGDLHAN